MTNPYEPPARADALCFVIHPRHREFYEALLPFRWLSEIAALVSAVHSEPGGDS